jgi:hypothetical protein
MLITTAPFAIIQVENAKQTMPDSGQKQAYPIR